MALAAPKIGDIPAMLSDIVVRKAVNLPSPADSLEKPKTPPRDTNSVQVLPVACGSLLAEFESPCMPACLQQAEIKIDAGDAVATVAEGQLQFGH